MIALLALITVEQSVDTVRGRVLDASSSAPVAAALVTVAGSRATTDDAGAFQLVVRSGDTVVVRRIGYRPARQAVRAGPVTVWLIPEAVPLGAREVRGAPSGLDLGRLGATIEAAALRRGGAVTLGDAAPRLPLVSARSLRGGVALSMRGSRPEQVLVLLDGVPLNDPATASADVSEVPLLAIGSATVLPGAAGATYGSGASGGVISLSTGHGSAASIYGGAFGRAGAAGAASAALGGAMARVGAEWSYARNDYPFANTDRGDRPERRANNDEHRVALFGSATGHRARLALLASTVERGLVGPVNVTAFDGARGRTRRAMLSVATGGTTWMVRASARGLGVAYEGPPARSTHATWSGDVEAGTALLGIGIRAGIAADHASGTALRDTMRPRTFVALDRRFELGAWHGAASARLDAVRDAGVRVSPALALERSGLVTLHGRVGRAFRAPTLYDLYFASPRWLSPGASLRPERVDVDVEFGARVASHAGEIAFAVFERRTSDAIVWLPGTFDWHPSNVGRELVRGAEARARLRARWLTVDTWGGSRITRLHIAGDEVDVRTPYVPYADGGATVTASAGALTVFAAATVIGRRPIASVPNPSASSELPSVFLLDADVTWRTRVRGAAAALSIAVRNAADSRWYSTARYPAPARSWLASVLLQP